MYLDDIIVQSFDLDSHLVRLGRLLEELVEAGLKLKVSKCQLLQQKMVFLGHRVSAAGFSTDPEMVAAAAE